MQACALSKLSILSGSCNPPPKLLYNQHWPSRFRRILQIIYNTFQLATSNGVLLCVEGPRVQAGLGRVTLNRRSSIRSIIKGACILPGASMEQLADSLQLSSISPLDIYLADGDVLIVLGESLNGPAVAHISEDSQLIERHIAGIKKAHETFQTHDNPRIAPKILSSREHRVGHILVQQRLHGATINAQELNSEQLLSHFRSALAPLSHLIRSRAQDSPLPDGDCIERSTASLSVSSEAQKLVLPFIPPLKTWLSEQERVATVAHGDYWFPNILFEYQPLPRVSGLIDWERSREYATVGVDGLHLLMFAFSHWRGCPEPAVLKMIWSGVQEPTLEALTDELSIHSKIPKRDLGYLALQVWIMHISRNAHTIQDWKKEKKENWLTSASEAANKWISNSN